MVDGSDSSVSSKSDRDSNYEERGQQKLQPSFSRGRFLDIEEGSLAGQNALNDEFEKKTWRVKFKIGI